MSRTLVERLDISGTHNFRAVAPDGIRPGRLYRSDAIARLGDSGRTQLADLGIRRILDLRTEEEVAQQPDDVDAEIVEVIASPLYAGSLASMLQPGFGITDLYRLLIEDTGPAIADALHRITDADGAVLVHCTAGKDRTGIVVALALAVAGVERDVIVADYASTEDFLAGEWAEAMIARVRAYGVEPSAELTEILVASPAPAIEHVFALIEDTHGGLEVYLDRIGFAADARARLASVLREIDAAE
ncbi:tyrosine-protein phosphatase [Microbacterium thalassium]|uniref:Protein-tyrosine phosphatase n=1 Tax=Microbacterium thalassium TaxID=362649 RepID=A0A7X0KTT2_9MICO|nr:tyrosine-protein phosphatase [Microbacterium thalassium]MBB6390378.1 protein-tyrosine phosphatase [Microbacterium thalassium]GLK25487.1 phosphotyrosine protein phosphatase [Microbacterium thalassium]